MPGTEGSRAIVGGTDKYLTGHGTKKHLQSHWLCEEQLGNLHMCKFPTCGHGLSGLFQ